MDASRSLRKSFRDQNGPTQYVNSYVREGNTRKSRTGDNHNGGPSSLRINTNFSPAKRKSRRFSGDQIDAIRAHCAGEQSPESGGSWIRRNKAARTDAMAETPAPDDSETSRSHPTPMTSRITEFWRMFLGNLETPEEHEGVEYEEKRFDSSEDLTSLLSQDTSTRPAPAPAETTQKTETLFSSDLPVRSSAAEGIIEESRGTEEEAVPPSPLTNLPISSLNEPRSPSSEQSTSQDGIDGKELPPLPPSAIDRPPTDPGAHTPIDSTSATVDAPTDCGDNDKKDNEANATAAEATSSSVNIDHPIAGDASLPAGSPSLPHENRNTNVGDITEDASKIDQASSTSHTQSAPEIVLQSSPVSAGAEPVADKSKSQPEHTQDESTASEAKETDKTDKLELEKKTSQVPETETEQGASDSTGEPPKETSRLIVLERVPNLLVSENELNPADIPAASGLSNTVEHHVDNPGSQTQECHVGSSPAATGTPGERDETPTTSATANAGEIHPPEVPVLLITPPESSSPVVINDLALVNTASSPNPSPSSSSPPAESTVDKEAPHASDMLPLSTSPDDSSARDNLGNGSAAATQDMDVTALVSPSVNQQSSSPDESTLSGEKSASQGVTDGRQLPHILTLPFPFTFDVSLALSLIPTSNFSSSMAEDWAKACNNDDMRPVKEVKLLTQQTAEVVPSSSNDTDRSITGESSLTTRASSPSSKNRNAKAGGSIRDKSAASRASSNPRAQPNSARQINPMNTREDKKPLSAKEKRKAKKGKRTKAESTQDQGDTTAGEEMGEMDLHGSEQAVPTGTDALPPTPPGNKGNRKVTKNSGGEVQDAYRLSVEGEASNPLASESESVDPTSTTTGPQPPSRSSIEVSSAAAASRAAQTEGEATGSKRGGNPAQGKTKAKTETKAEREKEIARKKEQKARKKQRDKSGTNTKPNASSKTNKVQDVYDNFTDSEEQELLSLDNGQGDPSETKHVVPQENATSNTPDAKAADSVPLAAAPTTDNPDVQTSGSSSRENQDTGIFPSSDQHKPEATPASKATVTTGETDRTDSTPQTSQSDSRDQVPTGNLVDLNDEAEQTTVPTSSTDAPPVTPRQTMESSISPVLPPLPDSLSGFSIILDFLQANTPDNPTESIAVSTSDDLASPLEARDSDTENVISPTRSLFPSMSQEFEHIDLTTVTSPQGTKMSHAKAGELRVRNQQLKEQCDGWKKKYEELERRHRELEDKCHNLEKSLADAAAVGADWSDMNISQ